MESNYLPIKLKEELEEYVRRCERYNLIAEAYGSNELPREIIKEHDFIVQWSKDLIPKVEAARDSI